jgi:hypothetical protein
MSFKCGADRRCICGQLDYGGHEHCAEAFELLNAPQLYTLTSILNPEWRCWTILGRTHDELYEKCIRDFPGRTKSQWESYLVPVKTTLQEIPKEYRPTKHRWIKPWIRK